MPSSRVSTVAVEMQERLLEREVGTSSALPDLPVDGGLGDDVIQNRRDSVLVATNKHMHTRLGEWVRRWLERLGLEDRAGQPLEVHLNQPERTLGTRRRPQTNATHTTKYNALTFLPKNLFEQFQRLANLYFLLISCLQLFTDLSPTGRTTTLFPLMIVMGFTAAKDAYEDWWRYRFDEEANNRKAHVLRGEHWAQVTWRNVRRGDIVRVEGNNFFPADLVLLSSPAHHGVCYVETSNIDGESNLKLKQPLPLTAAVSRDGRLGQLDWVVRYCPPNTVVTGPASFQGCLVVSDESGETEHQLTHEQFLLRGSQLRNTNFVIGVVVYVGADTKIALNSRSTPHKVSSLERLINKCLGLSFFALCALALLGASMHLTTTHHVHDAWYLESLGDASWGGLWITYLLLLNSLIPLSLYVTLEMCKMVQARYIGWDVDMRDGAGGGGAMARTSSLNEELGQVDVVLTDKTGTLTQNMMEFRVCSVGGAQYGMANGGEWPQAKSLSDAVTTAYQQGLDGAEGGEEGEQHALRLFVDSLVLNSTVVPEGEGMAMEYQASSPDEKALVECAAQCGVCLRARGPESVTVFNAHTKEEEQVAVLHTLEFTSERRRMSVVCRARDGTAVLYCKGADCIVLERLHQNTPAELLATTQQHIDAFAEEGLRTLAVAYRTIPTAQYAQWAERWHQASVSLQGRESRLQALADEVETGLTLLGVTGIEDRLQDGVPRTIAALHGAGIKVWMLTGDKQQTAINIAHSCRLLPPQSILLQINGGEEPNAHRAITQTLKSVKEAYRTFHALAHDHRTRCCMIVGGETLRVVLDNDQLCEALLSLARRMVSVICCRASPMQKAQLTRLMREGNQKVTLAIGDGANDVPMLLSAHVGVGIAGNEGMQAVRASDYSIHQFQHLTSLLFVHGHWAYHRVAFTALYSFYKNLVLFMIQFWFAPYNLWSGQSLYERWTQAAFNIVFTSLPVFAFGCVDRDVSKRTLKRVPALYLVGRRRSLFTTAKFLRWVVRGLYHSLVAFHIPRSVFRVARGQAGIVAPDGIMRGLFVLGTYSYTAVVLIVTLRILLLQRAHTWITTLCCAASVAAWFLFTLAYSRFSLVPTDAFGLLDNTADHPTFWVVVPVTVAVALLPDFVFDAYARNFAPRSRDIALAVQSKTKSLFGFSVE